ncbi:hypothetical protein BG015_005850 [Linnemannia schmuckeri]|uniref:Homeobox domain-containing protein n=1 Tax=Linnemannia schmuckeri TaxID=64567 RepID=A0A9P5VBW2_9FUNG|nr:hypothetical protein BG015_005850 [Linnemannia schmuckeri]
MSGPHQQSTATGPEHKEQHNTSRIQISHLLCSIEAAEPTKSAPWDSPRTETLHLEDPSQQHNQPRTLQQPADINRNSEQQQRQDSDSDSDAEEQYDSHPFTSPLSTFNKTPVESSPVNHLAKHFSYSSSLTSPLGRAGYSYSHTTSPRHPMDMNDRRDSGLGRRELDNREPAHPNYSRSYKALVRETLSRSIIPERDPPTSPPSTTTDPGYFASRPTSSGQRSASLSINLYHDQLHPYEVDQQQQQRRTDRSKSDYALHQQNYGPYLDASPTIPPAVLFSSSRPQVYPQHANDLSTPPPSLPKPSYLRENVASPEDHTRPPYYNAHSSYRPIQSDPRRPSQGIMLPPPDAMLSSETKKSARIYGRDAADGPGLASFSSFNPKPSYDAAEQNRIDYVRRPSTQNVAKGFDHYAEERRSSSATSYPHDNQSRYQNSIIDRPSYDYTAYDSRRPSAAVPPAPAPQPRSSDRNGHSPRMDIQPPSWYQQYANAVPHKSQPRASFTQEDTSLYSPRDRRESGAGSSMEIQPPSWYQHYAHAVPPKPQPRTSHAQDDSSIYPSRDRRESGVGPSSQHRAHPDSWSAKSVLPLTPPTPECDLQRMRSSVGGEGYGHSSSKPGSKSSVHSVHPFDMPVDTPTSPSKATKRERDQEDDQVMPEDGVKAKRKRANAEQLSVLNAAFERSYFPSTEERLRLSKQTKMCPRTVQIWFQNKRQSVKARTDAMDAAVASTLAGRRRASQAVDRPSMEERRLNDRRQSRGGVGEMMMGGHHRQTSSPLSQSTTTNTNTNIVAPIQHGEKRRRSGPLTPADQDAAVDPLQIQLDGRSVDYFSRKRRATIAKMELNQSP